MTLSAKKSEQLEAEARQRRFLTLPQVLSSFEFVSGVLYDGLWCKALHIAQCQSPAWCEGDVKFNWRFPSKL